ncbi:MAG: hypothetical protein M3021_07720 [Actinomycetota bacterium]|nr:hypothetical protein [Actinomycetota bacterium]
MIETTSDHTLRVTVNDKANMDDEISAAVDMARENAMKDRQRGILVTREGLASFTVAVSDEVPYGITQEKYAC